MQHGTLAYIRERTPANLPVWLGKGSGSGLKRDSLSFGPRRTEKRPARRFQLRATSRQKREFPGLTISSWPVVLEAVRISNM